MTLAEHFSGISQRTIASGTICLQHADSILHNISGTFLLLHNLVRYYMTFFMHGILQRPEGNTAHVCGAKNVLLIKFMFEEFKGVYYVI